MTLQLDRVAVYTFNYYIVFIPLHCKIDS